MSAEKNKDQALTPLADALRAMGDRVSFHMPGHRQGKLFQELPDLPISSLDTTELEASGDLAAPSGHVLEAYRLAASFFGAAESWFITSGTTTSLFIMMAAALREGDRVIMPRAVHIAAVHAAAILGLEPVF
ncbi:MAG: arginine decarboxylase, partial [Clostridiaceae bacterium]|nr:arginine decarboxylase [Clostridiaceae bacterium]